MELRSAVVVAFPSVATVVDRWRIPSARGSSVGLPPHVTLVVPFVPAAALDEDTIAALQAACSTVEPFAVAFRELRRFPATLWLHPEPSEPFVRLTEAIVERFPEHPPYEGAFDEIVPHLTVAEGAALDDAERDVARHLPLTADVVEAKLLQELPDGAGWRVRATFPLDATPEPGSA